MMTLEFIYNSVGNGHIAVIDEKETVLNMPFKTGHIDADGDLVNNIKHGKWLICEKPFYSFKTSWSIHLVTPAGQTSEYCLHGDYPCNCKCPHIIARLRCNYRLLCVTVKKILKEQDIIEFIVKGEQ